ncbi:EAL domain-containing protein [soil metagenome]
MSDVKYIIREPVLGPKENVLGFALTWQQGSDPDTGDDDAADRIALVSQKLVDPENGWLLGDNQIFLQVTPALLSEQVLGGLSPKDTVLEFRLADLEDDDAVQSLQSLRDLGFNIALCEVDFATQEKSLEALLPLTTYLEIQRSTPDFAEQVNKYGSLSENAVKMIARGARSWAEFDACAALDLSAFVGNHYLTPRPGVQSKGLNPGQVMIVQLMEMVRKNADIRELEGVLKRDAALSYKLLRYINSVGFGLGAEIQSLKHAVTMLGYSPLYRWLSVLLASATKEGQSPVLMQTAVIRGRFAELLGKGFLPKNEAENLFVAGMFSLLDRLLGMPMEDVLEKLQLSESVTQALLSREGMYGPFLALAEACESSQNNVGELADSLFISALQVNEAHLSALAWAQNLKLS